MIYDLIIIGMGPAGISAGIYAKRAELNVLMLDKSAPGGLLNIINNIENYPGFINVSGPDLAMSFFNQVNELKIPYKLEEVIDVNSGDIKEVVTKNNKYQCKSIIITTGREARTIGLKNEDKFLGKGLSKCALCDGAFYKGKDVCVVGGGNSALGESLYLASLCHKVYLVHRRDEFTADKEYIDKVKNTKNIELLMKRQVVELNGEDYLKSVTLDNGEVLNVDGLFTYIGYKPMTNFAVKLDLVDDKGYIEVDKNMETKEKGIFAAGDIIKKDIYQIVTATSEGAIASINANKYIKSKK